MALEKRYMDIPGTTIFDADQSRRGYHLNQFCMSLMKADNRARFKANERAYLEEWPMKEEQKQAVLDRDLNRGIPGEPSPECLEHRYSWNEREFYRRDAETQRRRER